MTESLPGPDERPYFGASGGNTPDQPGVFTSPHLPTAGPDELIEAARVLHAKRCTVPGCSGGSAAPSDIADVRILHAAGLLADPGLQAERERLVGHCRSLEARLDGTHARCSCDNDPLECTHEAARGQAEAELERLKAELAADRSERVWMLRSVNRQLGAERDRLQTRTAELEASVGHHAVQRGEAIAEREQLKARIDAATAELKKWDALATRESEWMPCRAALAALQGAQPTSPQGIPTDTEEPRA